MKTKNDFYKNPPEMALFEITTRCNLACSYCVARSLIKNPSDLPMEKIQELKKPLDFFEYIAFCGLGESLIHENFYQILGIFKDKKVVIVTNGSIPIDYHRLTVYDNVDAISFSVDGATEESMKQISSNYGFDILLKNLENASKYGVNIAFNTTITKENIDQIEDLQEMVIKYKVNRFKVGLPLGKEKWVRKNFNWLQKVLKKLEKRMKIMGVDYEGPFEVKCSFNNAPIAVVSKNGNIYPCCDYFCSRPLAGNLYYSNFETLWKKSSYDKFRTGEFCNTCKQYHNSKELIDLYTKE